jgi:uncharacterized protein YkwD
MSSKMLKCRVTVPHNWDHRTRLVSLIGKMKEDNTLKGTRLILSLLVGLVGLFFLTLFLCPATTPTVQATGEMPPAATSIGVTQNYTTYLPIVFGAGSRPPENWLEAVNYYRAMAGLPSVTENVTYSDGTWKHARYMVKNDYIGHSEDPANPWYTPEGLQAAQSSNLMVSSNVNTTDEDAISLWMSGPFHALGIIDPALHEAGFGSYRENIGSYRMGAALDVIRGLGSIPGGTTFPIYFPKDGAYTPLLSHSGESPSPLTSCPGYSAPSGSPIILQIGDGSQTPTVTAHSLLENGAAKDHCIFDETNYCNPDSGSQSLGRSILDSRDAIVIMPRHPLVAGAEYTVSITVNGSTYTWSFRAF